MPPALNFNHLAFFPQYMVVSISSLNTQQLFLHTSLTDWSLYQSTVRFLGGRNQFLNIMQSFVLKGGLARATYYITSMSNERENKGN
jgi:hypothetical protein